MALNGYFCFVNSRTHDFFVFFFFFFSKQIDTLQYRRQTILNVLLLENSWRLNVFILEQIWISALLRTILLPRKVRCRILFSDKRTGGIFKIKRWRKLRIIQTREDYKIEKWFIWNDLLTLYGVNTRLI